ncbi:MAG: hypothetical protein AB1629_03670 [Candidatus Omnitrophota bacterium]
MEKKKICPICQKKVDASIIKACTEAEKYVIENIRRSHPEWVEKDGACPKCIDYYKNL